MFSFDWSHLWSLGSDAVMALSAIKSKNPHMIAMAFSALIKDLLGFAGADTTKFDKYTPVIDTLTTNIMADVG